MPMTYGAPFSRTVSARLCRLYPFVIRSSYSTDVPVSFVDTPRYRQRFDSDSSTGSTARAKRRRIGREDAHRRVVSRIRAAPRQLRSPLSQSVFQRVELCRRERFEHFRIESRHELRRAIRDRRRALELPLRTNALERTAACGRNRSSTVSAPRALNSTDITAATSICTPHASPSAVARKMNVASLLSSRFVRKRTAATMPARLNASGRLFFTSHNHSRHHHRHQHQRLHVGWSVSLSLPREHVDPRDGQREQERARHRDDDENERLEGRDDEVRRRHSGRIELDATAPRSAGTR